MQVGLTLAGPPCTSEYRKDTDYSIYKESPPHAVIMMLP